MVEFRPVVILEVAIRRVNNRAVLLREIFQTYLNVITEGEENLGEVNVLPESFDASISASNSEHNLNGKCNNLANIISLMSAQCC